MVGFYGYKIANFVAEILVEKDKKAEVRFVVAIVDKEKLKEEKTGAKEGKPITKEKLPPLRIGNIYAPIPIIQGGMAVRVALHNLAGNVAKEGGVGIVAVSGMTDPAEVKEELRKARQIAGPKGVLGINIMGVASHFTQLVTAAMEEDINLVIQGAGFRKDIFELGKKYNVPIFSMASSAKVAEKGEKMGAAAIVVEGKDAGGHLGFPRGHPFRKAIDIVKEVVERVKTPVIAAGGVFDGKDIVEMFRAGAQGVQMATRFVVTEECDAHPNFKQAYLDADKEDGVIIRSPVGLPGRAIKTPFVDKVLKGEAPPPDPRKCKGCISSICDKNYCILDALEQARKGDLENGLVFAGSNFWRIEKMTTVKELLAELVEEANQILSEEPLVINK
ncbi:MAG: nitronate monooxygenase [Candidatus Nealsonbacteria bacterium]|nr:nitronate monooxygenase [Candidatus Nealsonbacteria bacterium]